MPKKRKSPSYRSLGVVKDVLFTVPVVSPHTKWVSEHLMNGKTVNGHWINGLPIKTGLETVIINRHYYVGTTGAGKTFVGDVKVEEKTTIDGRKFLLVNFYERKGAFPKKEIKFLNFGTNIPKKLTHQFLVSKDDTAGIAVVSIVD